MLHWLLRIWKGINILLQNVIKMICKWTCLCTWVVAMALECWHSYASFNGAYSWHEKQFIIFRIQNDFFSLVFQCWPIELFPNQHLLSLLTLMALKRPQAINEAERVKSKPKRFSLFSRNLWLGLEEKEGYPLSF